MGKDYPQIDGYSQGDISISASVFGGIRFISNTELLPNKLIGEFFRSATIGRNISSGYLSSTNRASLLTQEKCNQTRLGLKTGGHLN